MDKNKRNIFFNADDYGLAPGIGEAIRNLIVAGRLSSTSCMTSSPHWPEEAEKLKAVKSTNIQVGLHFTLTDQAAIGPSPILAPDGMLPSFPELFRKALTGSLPINCVNDQLVRQWDSFKSNFGHPPDFIDGHHHVHQLPGIRNVVTRFVSSNSENQQPWVRCCWESPTRILIRGVERKKAFAIGWFGWTLKRQCDRENIRTNPGFAGVYDFNKEKNMATLMPRFLSPACDQTVLMCHPGFVDDILRKADSLLEPREEEYRYMMSEAFTQLLESQDVKVGDAGLHFSNNE